MPKTKKEAYEKIKNLISAGNPINADEILKLVYYLSDSNSLRYDEVINYLKSQGESVIPYIKKGLFPTDDEGELHTSLLHAIVKEWSTEWVERISSALNDL